MAPPWGPDCTMEPKLQCKADAARPQPSGTPAAGACLPFLQLFAPHAVVQGQDVHHRLFVGVVCPHSGQRLRHGLRRAAHLQLIFCAAAHFSGLSVIGRSARQGRPGALHLRVRADMRISPHHACACLCQGLQQALQSRTGRINLQLYQFRRLFRHKKPPPFSGMAMPLYASSYPLFTPAARARCFLCACRQFLCSKTDGL